MKSIQEKINDFFDNTPVEDIIDIAIECGFEFEDIDFRGTYTTPVKDIIDIAIECGFEFEDIDFRGTYTTVPVQIYQHYSIKQIMYTSISVSYKPYSEENMDISEAA